MSGGAGAALGLEQPGEAGRLDGWPAEVVGSGIAVPTLGGGTVPYAYLDNAASKPALIAVRDAVNAFLPYYSSVHRGAGYKSRLATACYEAARDRVRRFVNAADDRAVIFIKNTTEGINRLARLACQRDATVFVSVMEHHANMLPWRIGGRSVRYFQADEYGVIDEDDLARQLAASARGPKMVAIAGAYNVSGYAPPVHRIARIAHEHGAEIVVDAAQLAAHRRIDVQGPRDGEELDHVVFSSHKLYAPFGSGALIAPAAAFADVDPAVTGGGVVELVLLDDVIWNKLPDREEAGSPNVVGSVALAAALQRLDELDRDVLERQERGLTTYLLARLATVPGLQILGPGADASRVGVVTFTLEGRDHDLVAAALGYEHGIGVRSGCFCAHPGVFRLLGVRGDDLEALRAIAREERSGDDRRLRAFGAVRVSLGLQNTRAEVDRLVSALHELTLAGPRGRYRVDERDGGFVPEDQRDEVPPELAHLVGHQTAVVGPPAPA